MKGKGWYDENGFYHEFDDLDGIEGCNFPTWFIVVGLLATIYLAC